MAERFRGDGGGVSGDMAGDVDGCSGSVGGECGDAKAGEAGGSDSGKVEDGGVDVYLTHYLVIPAGVGGIQHNHRHERFFVDQ